MELVSTLDGRALGARVLVFDIETSPMLSWHWRCYDENISPQQVERVSQIMCFAAKWLGEDSVYFKSMEGHKTDKPVLKDLWNLVDRADIVVAHNGNAFDLKTIRARWIVHGFDPPSPYKSIDTLKLATAVGRFSINKLDYLGKYFSIGRKLEHEGFGLWLKCMAGDKDAWLRMEGYNVQDVLLLEQLYLKLRPWDKKHPNVALYYDDGLRRCTVCGAASVKSMPHDAATSVSLFPVFRCTSCGKVMRSRKKIKMDTEVLSNVQ
jgi:hypothetical protein